MRTYGRSGLPRRTGSEATPRNKGNDWRRERVERLFRGVLCVAGPATRRDVRMIQASVVLPADALDG